MKILRLHDINNPTREVLFPSDEFGGTLPLATGCVVLRKDSDVVTYVHESEDEVATLLEEEL